MGTDLMIKFHRDGKCAENGAAVDAATNVLLERAS